MNARRSTLHSTLLSLLPVRSTFLAAASVAVVLATAACGSSFPEASDDPVARDGGAASSDPGARDSLPPDAGPVSAPGGNGSTSDASVPTPVAFPPKTTPAGEVFWAAFNQGRYDRIGDVKKSLDDAIVAAPKDAYLKRLSGLASFWQVAEAGRDPKLGPLEQAMTAFKVESLLSASKADDPEDPWTSCFLGIIQHRMARVTGDAAKAKSAAAEFERGIAKYPAFTTYCRALAQSDSPRGSDEFLRSLDDFRRVIAICQPDVTEATPVATSSAGMDRCTQRARVPHGYNGFWLSAGDVFLKAGKKDLAKAYYGNAKLAHYADWSLKSVLEDRLAKLEENAARFADADTSNDLVLSIAGPNTCVGCHSAK